MLSYFGNSLLILNVFITLLILYFSSSFLTSNVKFDYKIVKRLILSQLSITVVSFFTLLFAFIITDLSIISVYSYSHESKPIFYKIAGTWGNHEGSLMLWVLILVVFSFLFYLFNNQNLRFRI